MDLSRLAEAIGATGQPPVEILDLAYDPRAVAPGALFFCIAGTRRWARPRRGRRRRRGGRLVVERPVEVDVPQFVVPSVRAAMPRPRPLFFGDPSRELEVAAVTGTNGKTTTAFLLRSILDDAGPQACAAHKHRAAHRRRAAADRTEHPRVDRPAAAVSRRCSTRAIARARWRRRRSRSAQGRLAGTRFAVLVFTNLTQDHLDFHGTMEEYFAAKRALFDQAERAVINVGDEWGGGSRRSCPSATRSRRTTTIRRFDLKLRGRFNRANALGAIWAARELGIDDEAIRRGIERRRVCRGASSRSRRGSRSR